MRICTSHNGIALVTVLFITSVGLLFGAGALLLFRNQCQLRIERQHEMEKIYSVRSALNYIRPYGIEIGDGKSFGCHTSSGRDFLVYVKPVDKIFPNFNEDFRVKYLQGYPGEHFATDDVRIEKYVSFPCCVKDPSVSYSDLQYNSFYDYEYGGECELPEGFGIEQCITNHFVNTTGGATGVKRPKRGESGVVKPGLTFTNATESTARLWLNIGMRGTGGWLQEEYGRRYAFKIDKCNVSDVIRLCLIQNVTNKTAGVGRIHGWPMKKSCERALVFEISVVDDNTKKLSIYMATPSGSIKPYYLENVVLPQSNYYIGLQVAHKSVSYFYFDSYAVENGNATTYENTACKVVYVKDVGEDFDYFSKWFNVNGDVVKKYDDTESDQDGIKAAAPELRAVFEVVSNTKGGIVAISDFRVMPAYQYDVSLVMPSLLYRDPKTGKQCYDLVTNLATVAQKSGIKKSQYTDTYTMFTYDTHGTEHKGFRQDEREAERRALAGGGGVKGTTDR